MKVTVFSSKGSAGKTPIATNIALDREYAIATNETYHIFTGFIPESRLLTVGMNDSFPTFDDSIDVVFDLAGAISDTALSVISAIEQSDLVIVPIWNEVKSIHAGLNSIAEVMRFNKNVIVVATKLQKQKGEGKLTDWSQSTDYLNVLSAVHHQFSSAIPVLPLKYSKVFDTIFEQEKSINALCQESGIASYHYREVQKQFEDIYSLIDKYAK